MTGALRKLLQQVHAGKPLEELVAERWLEDALLGEHAQLQMLLDCTEGKLTEKHQVNPGGRPKGTSLTAVLRLVMAPPCGPFPPRGSGRAAAAGPMPLVRVPLGGYNARIRRLYRVPGLWSGVEAGSRPAQSVSARPTLACTRGGSGYRRAAAACPGPA